MTTEPKLMVCIVALLTTVGCATPAVQFNAAPGASLDSQGNRTTSDAATATNEADKGAVYFDIPTAKLTFTPKAGWTDTAALDPFTMGVTPLDSDEGFYVTPKSKLFQSKFFSLATTALTVTPLPNTNIPVTVSVTVTDNTQELLTTAGSIASSILKLGAAAGPNTVAEFALILPDTKASLPESPQPIANFPSGWKWQIWLNDPTAGDAIKLTDFTAATVKGNFVAYFPFPACRSLKVEVTTPMGNTHDYYAQVGTPEWVEPIAIPANGKITAGSSCGASSTPGSTDPLTSLKDVATAISQVTSILGTAATTTKSATSPASNSK